jgi:uncharacterized protein (TIGR02646 family)
MKFVHKQGAPHKYKMWRRRVKRTSQEDYREMPGEMKAAVLAALVMEQGEICAYTMIRVDAETSHIEHIKPESLCRKEEKGSDLDFDNMLSCFPRNGMRRAWRYGAQRKGSWWDSTLFISPLEPLCEKRFRFNLDGEISVVGANKAASKTIEVLALDHPTLTEDRRRAIHEFIYGKDGDNPLSKVKASQLKMSVCNRSGGQFVEFCVAFRDALEEHITYVKKLARKRGFARRRAR